MIPFRQHILEQTKQEEFTTTKEMVDYISDRIPKSLNKVGFRSSYIRSSSVVGGSVTFVYMADKRGLQDIDHNNFWMVKLMIHSIPEEHDGISKYKFEGGWHA